MKRQALVLDDELHTLIAAQAAQAAGTSLLFPRPTKNPDGIAPISARFERGKLVERETPATNEKAA